MKTWEELKPALLRPLSELNLPEKTLSALGQNGIHFIAQMYGVTQKESGLEKRKHNHVLDKLVTAGFPLPPDKGILAYEGADLRRISLKDLDPQALDERLEQEKEAFLDGVGLEKSKARWELVSLRGVEITAQQFHLLSTPVEMYLGLHELGKLATLPRPPVYWGQLLAYSPEEEIQGLGTLAYNRISDAAALLGLPLGRLAPLKEQLLDVSRSVGFEGNQPLREKFAVPSRDLEEAFKARLYELAKTGAVPKPAAPASGGPEVQGP